MVSIVGRVEYILILNVKCVTHHTLLRLIETLAKLLPDCRTCYRCRIARNRLIDALVQICCLTGLTRVFLFIDQALGALRGVLLEQGS